MRTLHGRPVLRGALACSLVGLGGCTAFLGANDPIELSGDDGSEDAITDTGLVPTPDAPAMLHDSGPGPSDVVVGDSTTSSRDATMGPPDTGTPPPPDAAPWLPDASVGPPDSSVAPIPPPPGERLVAGSGFEVWGITSDGFIIASDTTETYAFSVTGATQPIPLTAGQPFTVIVSDATAFVWTNVSSTTPYIGTLTTWSYGSPVFFKTGSAVGIAYEYQRSLVFHVEGASGSSGQLVVTPFGTNAATSVAASVFLGASPADPSVPRFVETYGGLFIGFCADGSGATCVVVKANTTGGIGTVSSSTTPIWAVDQAGDTLLYSPPSGGGARVGTDGGTTLFDEDAGVLTGAALYPSGSDAVIVANGALKRITLGTLAETTLAVPAAAIWMLSPQQQQVLYSSVPLDAYGNGDLQFASTTTPNPGPTTLGTAPAHPIGFVGPSVIAWLSPVAEPQGSGPLSAAMWNEMIGAAAPPPVAGNSLVQRLSAPPADVLVYDDLLEGGVPGRGNISMLQMGPSASPVAPQANILFATASTQPLVAWASDTDARGAGIYIATLPP